MDPLSAASSRAHHRPHRHGRAAQDQRFSSYLTFGLPTTICMSTFVLIYTLTLLILFPLLQQEAPTEAHLKRGSVLKPVFQKAVDRVKRLPRAPGQLVAEEVAGVIKKKFDHFRHEQGVTDAELLNKAVAEVNNLRAKKNAARKELERKRAIVPRGPPVAPGKRTGFMVLGMHRSGTSMLTGLMATGMGYKTGGPLIGGAFDNVKGFFERLDVVYQNDEFMNEQKVWWNLNVPQYDAQKALDMKKDGTVDFKNGQSALAFFSDPNNAPWVQKDPRQCITLKTWLPLMSSEPAILFTYRHPLEVAHSLKKREQDFRLERGLRLWIIYNMRAVQNSAGLCRVLSSNDAILADPLNEVQRISDELTSKCGVPAPPQKLMQEDVDRFIDPNLQHHKSEDSGKQVIADYEGCQVHEFEGEYKKETPDYEREHDLYMKAMKIYCDFKNGSAYKDDYEWPSLQ